MKLGARVRVTGGMREFVGKTGRVIAHERDGRALMNRVELDAPVAVPGVGNVTDDLWTNEYLKAVRA